MNVLLTAFQGTSSERLIQQLNIQCDKLVLRNDKVQSVHQLVHALESKEYRFVLSFGQKPVIKNKVYIELFGRIKDTAYPTSFDVHRLSNAISANSIAAKLSNNAGTSFCNHLYAHGLQYIAQSSAVTEMVFLHIPFEKNLIDFHAFSRRLQNAFNLFFTDDHGFLS